MKRIAAILMGALLVGTVQAQSFQEYLTIRKKFGIGQATSPAALQTFVGEKVVEVKGVVRGIMETSTKQILLLDNPEGGRELYVVSKGAPDWLRASNVSARMIIRAKRSQEFAEVEAELIAAATESEVQRFEAAEIKKAQEKAAALAKKNAKKPTNPTSRGGTNARGATNVPKVNTSPLTKSLQLGPEFLQLIAPYTDFIQSRNKKLARAEAQSIAEGVLGYSAYYGVDPRLVMALVLCESGFNPEAKSSAGAQGLGQLMPGTARGLGVSNSYDTDQNLYGTVKLLRGHLEKYTKQTGDSFEGLILALAAYNAGGGAVKRHGGVPPYKETQNYVRKVIATYKQLCGE